MVFLTPGAITQILNLNEVMKKKEFNRKM